MDDADADAADTHHEENEDPSETKAGEDAKTHEQVSCRSSSTFDQDEDNLIKQR